MKVLYFVFIYDMLQMTCFDIMDVEIYGYIFVYLLSLFASSVFWASLDEKHLKKFFHTYWCNIRISIA